MKRYPAKFLATAAILTAALAADLAANPAAASENGVIQYPVGAEGWMAGAVPPPGAYFINYTSYYTADRLNNGNGDKMVPAFQVDAVADALRFLYVSDVTILGGFWGGHVVLPLVHLDIDGPAGSDSKSGLGDMTINPIIVSWHRPNLHWAVGLDINLPTGAYDKNDIANIGSNYIGFQPKFGITYQSDGGFQASTMLMYDINTKNDDTDYQSGQMFHSDFYVGQKLGELSVGLGGYYLHQTTDDTVAGIKVGADGFRGEALALGPQLTWEHESGAVLKARWQHEFMAHNRSQGDRFWLKAVLPF